MSLLPKRRESAVHPIATFREEMNRLFDSFWSGELLPEAFPFARQFPSADVTETDDSVIVTAEVPGLEAKDIDLTVTGSLLTIKGEKKEEKEAQEKNCTHREVRYGAFSRTLQLPAGVDVENVKAECRKGVLKVTLAKTEKAKARKISVKGEPPDGK